MSLVRSPLSVTLLTLFPELFPGPLAASLTGKALENKLWSLDAVCLHDFGHGKHQNVDDTPYGGGVGMVMRADVVDAALRSVPGFGDAKKLYMSPRGRPFCQAMAKDLANQEKIIILCGRFEGVDERVLQYHAFEEVSIGDVVLTGGEIPAMALIDACVRLLPGVVGEPASLEEDSFGSGLGEIPLLEYPQYTRPAVWEGMEVPEVLTSGNHAEIKGWRQEQSEKITAERRPDLLK